MPQAFLYYRAGYWQVGQQCGGSRRWWDADDASILPGLITAQWRAWDRAAGAFEDAPSIRITSRGEYEREVQEKAVSLGDVVLRTSTLTPQARALGIYVLQGGGRTLVNGRPCYKLDDSGITAFLYHRGSAMTPDRPDFLRKELIHNMYS